MKYLLLVLISLVLAGCGGCGRAPGSYVGFEPYVDAFVAEGAVRGVSVDMYGIDIKLVDTLPENTLGICNHYTGHISLLKSFWELFPNEREELIFHELGHCVLGLGHSESGIMRPIHLYSSEYQPHRTEYLDILFDN